MEQVAESGAEKKTIKGLLDPEVVDFLTPEAEKEVDTIDLETDKPSCFLDALTRISARAHKQIAMAEEPELRLLCRDLFHLANNLGIELIELRHRHDKAIAMIVEAPIREMKDRGSLRNHWFQPNPKAFE